MSEQGSDSESDITKLLEKHILRKPCPASVSCEARTPRGGHHGNDSAESQSEGSKQQRMTRASKKGIGMLGKGKMEIFQIMSDLDPMSQVNSRKKQTRTKQEKVDSCTVQTVEESIKQSSSNIESALPKQNNTTQSNYVPKLENLSEESTANQKTSTDHKGTAAVVNSDIYDRLQALESSLSALTPRGSNDRHQGAYVHRQSEPSYLARVSFTPRDNGTSIADVSFQSEELEKWANLVGSEAQKSTARDQPKNASTNLCIDKAAKDYSTFLNDSGFTQPSSVTMTTPLHNSTALLDVSCIPLASHAQIQANGQFQGRVPIQINDQQQSYVQLQSHAQLQNNGRQAVPTLDSTLSNAKSPNSCYAPFQSKVDYGQLHVQQNGIVSPHLHSTAAVNNYACPSFQSNAQVPFQNSGQAKSNAYSMQDSSCVESYGSHQPVPRLSTTSQPSNVPTDTQALLYRVQQDMISRQREQNKLLPHSQSDASKMLFLAPPHNVNQTRCLDNQVPVSQSAVPVITPSQSALSNCPVHHSQSNAPGSHLLPPNIQSDTKDFSQSGVLPGSSPEHHHCQNCHSVVCQQNGHKLQLNRLDFTQPEPTTNLTLLVDSTKLFLHKEVLSAWSNRWRHLVHVNSSAGDQIVLRDTKLQTVLHLLQYIYGIHKAITDGNVHSLLELADKFEMPKIKSECEGYLLAKEASLKLLVIAQNFRLQQLYKKCLEKITRKDLHSLERNPLFSHLNATTTASIYKAEILRLRSVARGSEQNEMKSQQHIRKLKNRTEKIKKRLEEVGEQWIINRNRCFKHSVHSASEFNFSCAACNKRVRNQVQNICRENLAIRGSGLADVSLVSDDVAVEDI